MKLNSTFIIFHFILKENIKKCDIVIPDHLANGIKDCQEQEIVSLICGIF